MLHRNIRSFRLTVSGLSLLLGCNHGKETPPDGAYVAEIRQWHHERMSELKNDDGWLNLVGMFWLKEGENRFGSDPSNDLVFPAKAPPFLGAYFLEGNEVRVRIKSGIEILADGQTVTEQKLPINHDEQDQGALTLGSLRWFLIARDGQVGVRLRDLESLSVKHFQGVETYRIDPVWRIEATFVPHDPPKELLVATVLGTTREHASPGTLHFMLGEKTHTLAVLSRNKHGQLFVVFGDQTNGSETYAGGRFIHVEPPDEGGHAVIDFNKSYNPPCAFSAFSTCPLPPEPNRLPLKVTAGEKKYDSEANSGA